MDKELKEAIKKAMENPKEFYAAMREIRMEQMQELRNKRKEQWEQRKAQIKAKTKPQKKS